MSWRNTREYRIWRAKVIRRDKVCQVCGTRQRRVAHHINSGSYFKDLRFNPKNGVCLCFNCHSQFHNNYKRSYRQKCTTEDFENFKSLVSYFKDILKKRSNK